MPTCNKCGTSMYYHARVDEAGLEDFGYWFCPKHETTEVVERLCDRCGRPVSYKHFQHSNSAFCKSCQDHPDVQAYMLYAAGVDPIPEQGGPRDPQRKEHYRDEAEWEWAYHNFLGGAPAYRSDPPMTYKQWEEGPQPDESDAFLDEDEYLESLATRNNKED